MPHHLPLIPADVPAALHTLFEDNFQAITRDTGNLMLMAADHRMEHLHAAFYGPHIAADAADPEHIFRVAQAGDAGALAAQLGLISRYGKLYPDLNYIAKLNSKTNLVPPTAKEPLSPLLWSVADVVALAHASKLNLRGVGYTVYLGSMFESEMLAQAAQVVTQAHAEGLVALLWIYPRGAAVEHPLSAELAYSAVAVANCLGADFVKIHAPHDSAQETSTDMLSRASTMAGNTQVICSGGVKDASVPHLLETVYQQLHYGTTRGVAIGRNIHQRPFKEAVNITHALNALVYGNASLDEALELAGYTASDQG